MLYEKNIFSEIFAIQNFFYFVGNKYNMKTTSFSPASFSTISGLSVKSPHNPTYESILTTDALAFLAQLHRRFTPALKNLLLEREEVQQKIDQGWRPGF